MAAAGFFTFTQLRDTSLAFVRLLVKFICDLKRLLLQFLIVNLGGKIAQFLRAFAPVFGVIVRWTTQQKQLPIMSPREIWLDA